MAFLDDVLGGWTGGILVGLGAVAVAPAIGPLAASVVRPLAVTLVKGGLMIGDAVTGMFTEASTEVNSLVREARKPPAPKPKHAPAHH